MITQDIQEKIDIWLGESYNEETRKEIQQLVDEKNENELTERFYKELEFGTGGLRGIIGAGTNRMNIYTVGKVAQGVANYLLNQGGTGAKSIVIAYDSRRFSYEFSLHSALIFAANGIKSYLFEKLQATPILSFAIRHLNASAGLMLTASHNPPEYNGIKVYYSDGGQVLPPHDKGMIEEVRKIESVDEIKLISEQEARAQGALNIVCTDVLEAYYQKALDLRVYPEIVEREGNLVKIIYTPLHGTGNIAVREVLKRAGHKEVFVVPEQELPDGEFPTVEYPNPEESAALKLALDLAKEKEADVVMANDPDADRVGVAVRDQDGNYKLLNGNQVGVLLSYYYCSELQKKGLLPENPLIVKTIVSTDLINEICQDFNVELEETLTGFKYIAEKVKFYHDEEFNSKNFLFGFEESYGYNTGDFVRDKDGVSTCLMVAELCAFCKKENRNLLDYLDEIYTKYGYFLESLKTLTLKGKEGLEKIQSILTHLRENPPNEIAGIQVTKLRDVQKGIIKDYSTGQEETLDLPQSNVLTFYLENGGKVTARPSGTEPKVKFYFSFNQKDSNSLDNLKKEVQSNLDKLMDDFMNYINSI